MGIQPAITTHGAVVCLLLKARLSRPAFIMASIIALIMASATRAFTVLEPPFK